MTDRYQRPRSALPHHIFVGCVFGWFPPRVVVSQSNKQTKAPWQAIAAFPPWIPHLLPWIVIEYLSFRRMTLCWARSWVRDRKSMMKKRDWFDSRRGIEPLVLYEWSRGQAFNHDEDPLTDHGVLLSNQFQLFGCLQHHLQTSSSSCLDEISRFPTVHAFV